MSVTTGRFARPSSSRSGHSYVLPGSSSADGRTDRQMSDTSDIPSHRTVGGRRVWRLVAAGLVSVTLTGAAAGCSEADSPPLAGSDGQGAATTEVDAGRA